MGNRYKGFVRQGQQITRIKWNLLAQHSAIQELRFLVDAVLDEPDLRERVYERVRSRLTGDTGPVPVSPEPDSQVQTETFPASAAQVGQSSADLADHGTD